MPKPAPGKAISHQLHPKRGIRSQVKHQLVPDRVKLDRLCLTVIFFPDFYFYSSLSLYLLVPAAPDTRMTSKSSCRISQSSSAPWLTSRVSVLPNALWKGESCISVWGTIKNPRLLPSLNTLEEPLPQASQDFKSLFIDRLEFMLC